MMMLSGYFAWQGMARKISAWKMDRTGLAGLLQQSPARSNEPEQTISPIPMGAASLHISAFPT
jgi:hypothetical protein